jgi:membrane associated rhomboid family serine protease
VLIPIGDDDRKLSGPAYVTGLLLLANLGAFALQLHEPELLYRFSVVPYEIASGEDLVNAHPLDRAPGTADEIPQRPGPSPIYLTLLTSLFLHGGWLHLLGNLLYLWIFGDNVEHRFGHGVFLAFYLVSGVAGSLAQVALEPASLVPMLGASGAISGVLGAYLVLFPRNRVHAIFFFFIVSVPAALAIGFWVLFQFVQTMGMLAEAAPAGGGVAYAAHLGGFVAGAAMALVLRFLIKEKEHPSRLSRAIGGDREARRWW